MRKDKWWQKYLDASDPHSYVISAAVSFITTVVVWLLLTH